LELTTTRQTENAESTKHSLGLSVEGNGVDVD